MPFLLVDGNADTDRLPEPAGVAAGASSGRIVKESPRGLALIVDPLAYCTELSSAGLPRLFGGSEPAGPLWLVFEGFVHRDSAQEHLLPIDGLEACACLIERQTIQNIGPQLYGAFVALVVAPASGRWMLFGDRLGARIGFHAVRGRHMAVGSRCDHLARLEFLSTDEDPSFVASMFGLRPGPAPGRSPFRDVSALRPGEVALYDGESLRLTRQPFEIEFRPPVAPRDWVAEFDVRLASAVRGSFSPEERPCVMLSGGLDSTPIAMHAQAAMLESGDTLSAISWSLPGFPACNESKYVRQAASGLALELRQFDADELLPLRYLNVRMSQPDTPEFNPYREVILKCYELARDNGHRVVLNGASGDFLYPNPAFLMADQIRRYEFGQMLGWLLRALRTRGIVGLWRYPPLRQAARWLLYGKDLRVEEPPPWLTEQGRAAFEPDNWPPEADAHPFPRYARRLLGTTLPRGTAFENTVAGEYGLDRRDPLVNPKLVALFLYLPFSLSFREGTNKWIMREALKAREGLPTSIRSKGRTGLLHDYLKAGINGNRDELSRFLWETRPEWQRWLRPEPVHNALNDSDATDRERALMHVAVGYGLWQEQIARF